jgi:hypothetical protein
MADAPGGSVAGGQIATTILTVEAAASIFAAFCPSWFTVRSQFFHDQGAREGNIRAIRHGELAAVALTVPTGYAASLLVRSWLPLIGAVAISALMVAGYEYSIRHPAAEQEGPPPPWASALDWGAAKG